MDFDDGQERIRGKEEYLRSSPFIRIVRGVTAKDTKEGITRVMHKSVGRYDRILRLKLTHDVYAAFPYCLLQSLYKHSLDVCLSKN